VLNLLDAGAGEDEVVNALKALCLDAETMPKSPSVAIRHARQELANRLHKSSLERFAEYEEHTQIVRSGFQARHKYKPVFEMVDTNYTCVEKYDTTPPEKDERYRLVQQELAVKTMLVLTELVLDYNKLCANAQQGTSYTRDSLSVLTKPDEVDAIFADADAVFAQCAAQRIEREEKRNAQRQPDALLIPDSLRASPFYNGQYEAPTALVTKAEIKADAMAVLEQRAFDDVVFSSCVVGYFRPGWGGTFQFKDTALPNVRVEWDKAGSASVTQGNAFDGFAPVSPEALALLREAGVLHQ
jgi:hypothetical protein